MKITVSILILVPAILSGQDYSEYYEGINAAKTLTGKNKIVEMFEQDQEMRAKYYDAILFQRIRIGREWEALNKRQVERLVDITRKYGFPGEKLIGIDTKQMHPKISDGNISAGMPIVILIHHYSQPNKS